MIWAIGIFGLTFVLSLAAFVVLIVVLPADYFAQKRRRLWPDKPPLVRWLGIIGKNLLGLLLIALGIVLSLPGIPGQGLLTIVVGALLLDIPGKHHLVRQVVHRRGVVRNLNRLRSWFGRQALITD